MMPHPTRSSTFEVCAFCSEHAAVVRVVGDVDLAALPALCAAADACRSASDLTLELAGVTFLDSTGVQGLRALTDAVRAAGGTASVCSASRPVRRVLELLKISEQLTG